MFRTQGGEGYPVEVHRAYLAHDHLDPRIVRGDVEDGTAAKARAPDTKPIGIDLLLQRQPRQGAAVILDLVPGKDPLARLAATGTERAIVEQQHGKARIGESAGNWFEEHILCCSHAVRHRHGGHAGS